MMTPDDAPAEDLADVCRAAPGAGAGPDIVSSAVYSSSLLLIVSCQIWQCNITRQKDHACQMDLE